MRPLMGEHSAALGQHPVFWQSLYQPNHPVEQSCLYLTTGVKFRSFLSPAPRMTFSLLTRPR